MEEDNPITRHLELQRRFVTTGFYLSRVSKSWAHTRVRHICLNRNLRPSNWLTARIRQLKRKRSRTDPDWFRRDLMLDRDRS